MTLRVAIVAAVIAGLFAGPVVAGEPTPQERAEGRRVLTEFANCAADAEPELAARYVEAGDKLPKPDWDKLIDEKCMLLNVGELRMDSFYFRGALAQRLILKGDDAPADLTGVTPLAWPTPGDDEMSQALNYSLRLGECVDRVDPTGSRAVFATKIDSKDELEALRAIAPSIASCVPAGAQVRFNRTNLRVGMATSYYRLTHAAPASDGGA